MFRWLGMVACLLLGGTLWAVAAPSWRGLMIDTSRHFVPVEELETYLPKMQAAGLNVLHLHLADGPGWRFEVPAYPRLTAVGAWRVDKTDRPWNWRETEFWQEDFAAQGKQKYGGFYTAAELRALAQTAKTYGIRIVPEIDIPGHSAAFLTAYPELACPTNRDPRRWFLGQDVVCVGNPQTLECLTEVFRTLGATFPESPLHIGCDEVPTWTWDACPRCQDPAVRKQFYAQLVANVRALGHEVVAWDELGTTGIDVTDVTLMCWNDRAQPRPQDIACPYSYCYLDQRASRARLPHWTPPQGVRGVQINLWTEEMPTQALRAQYIDEGLRALKAVLERSYE